MTTTCQNPACNNQVEIGSAGEHRLYIAFRRPLFMDYEFAACSASCAIAAGKAMLDTHEPPAPAQPAPATTVDTAAQLAAS